MNLETKQNIEVVTKKQKLTVGTIILGIGLISIPIIITLFLTVPELGQKILEAKSEIFKGMFIGVTILPVFLFVTIKGGKVWYKQWWNWAAIGITCIALVTITLVSTFTGQSQGLDEGVSIENGMDMEDGVDMSGDQESSDGVMIMN
ncbi:MAG: hypothetical protein RR448_06715 [Niameybacter sp.]|uniref:hypothetical protein n=1 Tax=Niameybacter sp. TaxID=2033640 RepID=UPI002FCB359C